MHTFDLHRSYEMSMNMNMSMLRLGILDFCPYFAKNLAICPCFETIYVRVSILVLDYIKVGFYMKLNHTKIGFYVTRFYYDRVRFMFLPC